MNSLRIVFLFTFVCCFPLTVVSQSVNEVMTSIVPLRSNRTDVEKILGKPNVASRPDQYRTKNFVVNIVFSNGTCEKLANDSRRYSVEKDIVIWFQIVLHKRMELADLNVELENYILDTSGDLINFVTYRERDRGGTEIVVKLHEEMKIVTSVSRDPTKMDDELFGCKKVVTR